MINMARCAQGCNRGLGVTKHFLVRFKAHSTEENYMLDAVLLFKNHGWKGIDPGGEFLDTILLCRHGKKLLSELFGGTFLCRAWWLTQKLTAGKSAENTCLLSVQPQ